MSATISVIQQSGEDYGEGDTVAKNIFYFIAEDANDVSKDNSPVRIPLSGTNYSYEVYLRFRVDVAPDDSVFNFKVWTEDSAPTDIDITVNSDAVSTYAQPVDTQSVRGTRDSLFDYDSILNSISVSGTLENIGDKSDYLVLQEEVLSTAQPTVLDVTFFSKSLREK